MAKDKGLQASGGGSLVPVPPDLVGGLTIVGADDAGPKLSELKLYQGTPSEQKVYGMHPPGVFLDVLERKSMGTEISIALIGAMQCWVKFIKGQKFPEYTVYSKSEVPPEDLIPDPRDNNRAPCREQIQAVVITRDAPWPFLFRFKSTGLSCLSKTIIPLEKRRQLTGKLIGMYRIGTVDDKGPGGEDFKRLTATPDGDLPTELHELALTVKNGWAQYIEHVKAVAAENDAAGAAPI